jgi:hypothetical protein
MFSETAFPNEPSFGMSFGSLEKTFSEEDIV